MSNEDYKVGFGKPPKHSQFPPGVSGNKGRRKKVLESHKEIVVRVRDELVQISGKSMTKFELAMVSTMNATIKSGKPRDLKILFELLDKYAALPEVDRAAEAKAGADAAIAKIMQQLDRLHDLDPEDVKAIEQDGLEEARTVLACPTCGPALKARWRHPDRKARKARCGSTGLQKQVDDLFTGIGLRP